MSDYGVSGKRKSKGDKRAKARYQRYKRGGGKVARSKKVRRDVEKT